jgi:hypothetical protein
MSTSPEADFELDLHFLPAWAQKPADDNKYAQYAGRTDREDSGRDRRDHAPGRRRDQPQGRGPRQDRPGGPRPAQSRGPAGPRRQDDQRRGGRDSDHRAGPPRNVPPPAPLPELNCALLPDDRGVESLARQIKMTGRAYPLFEIAQLVLQKPERYEVTLSVRKNAEGQVAQPLFVCALDETVWLSQEEAIQHVLEKHFATFYQAEKTQTDPPKGTYTFVAQCGMSGMVLGPPNYHDYQNQLRKLHAERFSRMPFEAFKARVRIVRDEAVVKKWIEEQSFKTEYVCLNVPEALKLPTREEVEKHFREVHAPNIIKQVENTHLTGHASRGVRSPALARLIRQTWEDQKRFPLQVATVLSQKFATHGLQFFKVNKTVTHVGVARPHYLDINAAPVSDGIRKIVQFIDTHPKCTRRKLVESLAPGTPMNPVSPASPPSAAGTEATPVAPAAEPSPEYTAVVGDLHWLIHQGHVIEFATGILETARKPIARPEKKPEPAKTETGKPANQPSAEVVAASTPAPDAAPTAEALHSTAESSESDGEVVTDSIAVATVPHTESHSAESSDQPKAE